MGAISKEKMMIGTLELVLDFMLMQQKKNGGNIIGCFHTLLKRFELLLMALILYMDRIHNQPKVYL